MFTEFEKSVLDYVFDDLMGSEDYSPDTKRLIEELFSKGMRDN
jgi:hypothetical protein